jgi:pimeloyl-ACP methyl ester carboxylesterase
LSTLTTGDHTIAYDDIGHGPPLVLIHGHPFNRSMWAGQIPALSETYRVIAPDLRGYGETSVTPGKVTLADHAQDIATLLDALDVEQVILGGLSMGGQIVLEFYRQFPQRIRALLLADTFAQLDTPDGRATRLTTAERLVREGMDGYAREVLPNMIDPATIREQPLVAAHVLRMMRGTHPEGAAASLRGRSERRDYLPLLPTIAVPTLIVVGEDDVFTPVNDAERMHQAIPHAQLQIIERSGHMPNMEQAAVFNRRVQAWLAATADR